MALSNLGENIFIGDSAVTSHMTSNKLGVYNLVPINGSVMIGNGQSISCTHKGKLDVICKHKDESMARETWDVKIVPQLNHDLFSFTKAMKEGWHMNGRWMEGGLVIANKNSSTCWRIASHKRHYHATSVVGVQSKKSEDLNPVGPSDPISVYIYVKPITGAYLQLPNALSVASHLGTILGLIGHAKWSTLNGVSVNPDVPY